MLYFWQFRLSRLARVTRKVRTQWFEFSDFKFTRLAGQARLAQFEN